MAKSIERKIGEVTGKAIEYGVFPAKAIVDPLAAAAEEAVPVAADYYYTQGKKLVNKYGQSAAEYLQGLTGINMPTATAPATKAAVPPAAATKPAIEEGIGPAITQRLIDMRNMRPENGRIDPRVARGGEGFYSEAIPEEVLATAAKAPEKVLPDRTEKMRQFIPIAIGSVLQHAGVDPIRYNPREEARKIAEEKYARYKGVAGVDYEGAVQTEIGRILPELEAKKSTAVNMYNALMQNFDKDIASTILSKDQMMITHEGSVRNLAPENIPPQNINYDPQTGKRIINPSATVPYGGITITPEGEVVAGQRPIKEKAAIPAPPAETVKLAKDARMAGWSEMVNNALETYKKDPGMAAIDLRIKSGQQDLNDIGTYSAILAIEDRIKGVKPEKSQQAKFLRDMEMVKREMLGR